MKTKTKKWGGSKPHKVDRNIEWTDEQEYLLIHWKKIARINSRLHEMAYRGFKTKNQRISLPIAILSTIAGSANFAVSSVPQDFKLLANAIIGGISILAAILTSVMSIKKYSESQERHKQSSVNWKKIDNEIDIIISTSYETRSQANMFFEVIGTNIKDIIDQASIIPGDIIRSYEKQYGLIPAFEYNLTDMIHLSHSRYNKNHPSYDDFSSDDDIVSRNIPMEDEEVIPNFELENPNEDESEV